MDFTSQILNVRSESGVVDGTDATAAVIVAPPRIRGADATAAVQPDPAPRVPLPEEGDVAGTAGRLLDGRYALTELLGRGGSGEVYRGTDLRLRRPVAVKIFHSAATEPATAARQRAEMFFLARLNHPNLVSIYDAKVVTSSAGDGTPNHTDAAQTSYLVMEFVDGLSLQQRLSGTAMNLDESATVGIAVANALAAVHQHAMVHRDVKPANILLPVTGGAKLTDFGIARLLNSTHLTITSEVMGTPLYLSPEQATGSEVGPGTDIYSLGLVLLECVTGNPAFPGAPVQSVMSRLLRNPHVPDTLPAPWPDLLRSMTSTVPADRPEPAAVAATLTGYLQNNERALTATTITATALPSGAAPSNPAVPGRDHPVPAASVAAATPAPRLIRDLTAVTYGLALAVMTAIIVWTAGGDDHPGGPATTTSTTTPTITTAPASSVAATTPIAPDTDQAAVHPAPAVTVVTTETATTTETKTTSPSQPTTPPATTSTSPAPPTTTSTSPAPPTTTSTSPAPPTATSTSPAPPTTTSTTPAPPTTTSASPAPPTATPGTVGAEGTVRGTV